jgi:hypothetical protein
MCIYYACAQAIFHAFQDILVTTDGLSISVWSLGSCSRLIHIHNHNGISYPSHHVPPLPSSSSLPHRSNSSSNVATATDSRYTGGGGIGGIHSNSMLRLDLKTPPLPVSVTGRTTPGLNGLSAASVAAAYARTESQRSSSASPALLDPAGVLKPAAVEDARITSLSWINEAYDSLLLVYPTNNNMLYCTTLFSIVTKNRHLLPWLIFF